MAKSTKQVQRKGRRTMPASRRQVGRRAAGQVQVSLGELIAAAFDAAGGTLNPTAELLASQQLRRALGRRIVLV